MDDWIKYAAALVVLSIAIVYVINKTRSRNKEREYQYKANQERKKQDIDIELVIQKKEMDILEEQLRTKVISKENYEVLRKNLEEQHKKNIENIRRSKAK